MSIDPAYKNLIKIELSLDEIIFMIRSLSSIEGYLLAKPGDCYPAMESLGGATNLLLKKLSIYGVKQDER